jgi:hypothetical protein
VDDSENALNDGCILIELPAERGGSARGQHALCHLAVHGLDDVGQLLSTPQLQADRAVAAQVACAREHEVSHA